jgi:hypothetical protein
MAIKITITIIDKESGNDVPGLTYPFDSLMYANKFIREFLDRGRLDERGMDYRVERDCK